MLLGEKIAVRLVTILLGRKSQIEHDGMYDINMI